MDCYSEGLAFFSTSIWGGSGAIWQACWNVILIKFTSEQVNSCWLTKVTQLHDKPFALSNTVPLPESDIGEQRLNFSFLKLLPNNACGSSAWMQEMPKAVKVS